MFRRIYGLPYTPYVAKCCDILERSQEYDSDRFLIALIRMQRLVLRVHEVTPTPQLDAQLPHAFYGSIYMAIATIKKELDALVENQPPDVECNGEILDLSSDSRGLISHCSLQCGLPRKEFRCLVMLIARSAPLGTIL